MKKLSNGVLEKNVNNQINKLQKTYFDIKSVPLKPSDGLQKLINIYRNHRLDGLLSFYSALSPICFSGPLRFNSSSTSLTPSQIFLLLSLLFFASPTLNRPKNLLENPIKSRRCCPCSLRAGNEPSKNQTKEHLESKSQDSRSNLPNLLDLLDHLKLPEEPRYSWSTDLRTIVGKPTRSPSVLLQTITENHHLFRSQKHKDSRHLMKIVTLLLVRSADVESNPGPRGSGDNREKEIKVISYNVRGLNDELKLRHLINYCYKIKSSNDGTNIICLQETYLENPGKIPYLWRGNFHLTVGRGNSLGCLTLLNHHLNILQAADIENRAHVLAVEKTGQPEPCFIICNLYAPNVNNAEKINFFEKILDQIAEYETRYNCNKIIIAGDFNLTFSINECKNRAQSSQEKNVSRAVKNLLNHYGLADVWEKKTSFTWNRPNSEIFSTIDRVAFSKNNFNLLKAETDWSVSLSDHAAVITTLGIKSSAATTKSRITRLDPTLLEENKEVIISEIELMLADAPSSWDPHKRLEFLKVCIRTVLEKAQADRKRNELSEEELLNLELDTSIKALERGELNLAQRVEVINHVEELRARKAIMVENKGKRLAERLGTKWFNEGEKSTEYFLRILQRNVTNSFEEVVDDEGQHLNNEQDIEQEIVRFYKELYEKVPSKEPENDRTFFDQIAGISQEEDEWIARPVTKEELGAVLDSCKNSAPGPDGIPYSIIKGLWPIFGKILVDSWNFTVQTG